VANVHSPPNLLHPGLSVVTLLKDAAGDGHDARLFIGQIQLTDIPRAGLEWFRHPAPGFFSGAPLGLPLNLFLLVLGLLLFEAFLRSRLNSPVVAREI